MALSISVVAHTRRLLIEKAVALTGPELSQTPGPTLDFASLAASTVPTRKGPSVQKLTVAFACRITPRLSGQSIACVPLPSGS